MPYVLLDIAFCNYTCLEAFYITIIAILYLEYPLTTNWFPTNCYFHKCPSFVLHEGFIFWICSRFHCMAWSIVKASSNDLGSMIWQALYATWWAQSCIVAMSAYSYRPYLIGGCLCHRGCRCSASGTLISSFTFTSTVSRGLTSLWVAWPKSVSLKVTSRLTTNFWDFSSNSLWTVYCTQQNAASLISYQAFVSAHLVCVHRPCA